MTLNHPSNELLPCPFCGNPAERSVKIDGEDVTTCGDESEMCPVGRSNFTVEYWNTRALPIMGTSEFKGTGVKSPDSATREAADAEAPAKTLSPNDCRSVFEKWFNSANEWRKLKLCDAWQTSRADKDRDDWQFGRVKR